MQSIEIPLAGEEVLEVDLNDLQGNDKAIIDILLQEHSAPSLFLQFAFEYRKRGMLKEFENFLNHGKSSCDNEDWAHVLLLNTLGSYYIEIYESLEDGKEFKYDDESDGRSRDFFKREATQLVNKAEFIDRLDTFTLLLKGKITLVDNGDASYQFQNVLKQDPNSIPALAGLAIMQYQKKDWKACLATFQQILRLDPDTVPDVRIPIGVCFANLNMPRNAKMAFRKALSRNVLAKALLSLIDFNDSRKNALRDPTESRKSAKHAMKLLMDSFWEDPRNPVVGNQLAERLLHRNLYEKAMVVCETALKHAKEKNLQSESLCIKGKIHQAEKNYKECYIAFKKALDINPNSLMALYGCGQMAAENDDVKKAIEYLERILTIEPNSYETRRILASIYAADPLFREKAQENFDILKNLLKSYEEEDHTNVAEGFVRDPDVLLEMAVLAEKESISSALNVYNQLLVLMQQTNKDEVPPELLNNIAALHHLQAEESFEDDSIENNITALQTAETLYQQALIQITKEGFISSQEPWKINALQTSIRFNVARMYETKNEIEKAKLQYNEILKIHPSHMDCILRLGILEMREKNYEAALNRFGDALAIDPKYIDAWILVAEVHLALKQYKSSRKAYEKVLRELDKHDVYALCGTGNLCLRFALDDPKQARVHLKRAVEFFNLAIRHKPDCIKAAAGLGIAHAQAGQLEQAIEIFNQIQGLLSKNVDILMNTAHAFVELGKPLSAIAIYEGVLKRKDAREHSEILKSLAKAYFILGKSELDPVAMKKAEEVTQRAIELDGEDLTHVFNLALIKQHHAQVLNAQPADKRHLRSIHALNSALKDLEESERLFRELSNSDDPKGYNKKQASERADFSIALKRVTEKKIHETEVLEKQKIERLAEMKERKEKLAQEALEKQKLEQEREDEKRREIELKRQQLQEKMKLENERLRLAAEADSKRRERDDSDNDVDEDTGLQKRAKKKKTRTKPENEYSSSNEEEDISNSRKGKKSKLSSSIIHDESD